MNRMIALFQRRADEALKNFTIVRTRLTQLEAATATAAGSPALNANQIQEARLLEHKATKHSVELSVWQKAADLLRKEELNK